MMPSRYSRRQLLQRSVAVGTGAVLSALLPYRSMAAVPEPLFKISLGEWSLHRALFNGEIKHPDVARTIKQKFSIDALEYSAQFFKDQATNEQYLRDLKCNAVEEGVKSVLITVDNEGDLGDPNENARQKAVENHHKWVQAAKILGCESIRVNAYSDRSLPAEEQAKLVVDGLTKLVDYGASHSINVIVENHGWLSSNGQWLSDVIKRVNRPTCGTLPDFGNFHLDEKTEYDRYRGVEELMPFARAISAKSYDFDAQGNETTIDYRRMMKIASDAGFRGYVGVEYEGQRLSEADGILATKRLLETVRNELASES